MKALAFLFMAAFGALSLLAQDKCATCNGAKQVKCYQYGGKQGGQGPCAACLGTGGAPCQVCSGSYSRQCGNCSGTGRLRSFKCAVCEGVGSHPCKVCDKGRAKCRVCAGSGETPVNCDACRKTGKLPCPECAAMSVPCAGCEGSALEKCAACYGKGEAPTSCSACGGLGAAPCTPCNAFGTIACTQCEGLGAKPSMMPDQREVLQGNPCRVCAKAGELKCSGCKGRGTTACATCAGKGTAVAACWLCDGQKTMPCRRCGVARTWRGQSTDRGVRCVVFDCSTFQPQLAQGLKRVVHLGDFAVWRVVIDAREMRQRFALGGPDGWELVLVSSSGAEVPMKDAYEGLSPEQMKGLERWLQGNGDAAEALKRPFGVAGGDVRTCLMLTPFESARDATAFRLRCPTDPSISPVDLTGGEVYWSHWVQERLLAAPE